MASAPSHDVAHVGPCRGLRRPASNDATSHRLATRGQRRVGTSPRLWKGDARGNSRHIRHSLFCLSEIPGRPQLALMTEKTMKLTDREVAAAHDLGEAILQFITAIEYGSRQRSRAAEASMAAATSAAATKTEPRRVDERSLLTVKEVAEILSMSRSAIYNLMESGVLPYVKIGRTRRLRLNDVRKAIEQHTVSRN